VIQLQFNLVNLVRKSWHGANDSENLEILTNARKLKYINFGGKIIVEIRGVCIVGLKERISIVPDIHCFRPFIDWFNHKVILLCSFVAFSNMITQETKCQGYSDMLCSFGHYR